jgi:hypothetical protein
MEKKRKKVPGEGFKPHSKIEVLPKVVQNPGILGEKDRQILDDVQNIIWDPARLEKFKKNGNATDGFGKKKAAK